jgi:hypothetical protein
VTVLDRTDPATHEREAKGTSSKVDALTGETDACVFAAALPPSSAWPPTSSEKAAQTAMTLECIESPETLHPSEEASLCRGSQTSELTSILI